MNYCYISISHVCTESKLNNVFTNLNGLIEGSHTQITYTPLQVVFGDESHYIDASKFDCKYYKI